MSNRKYCSKMMPEMSSPIIRVSSGHYYHQIDFIKFFAIISVILLHEFPRNLLVNSFAHFHIWQAVPIFMVIAGLTSSLSANRERVQGLLPHYNFGRLTRRIGRILIPFFAIWFLQNIIILGSSGTISISKIIFSFLTGGYGPDSFFIPVIIQHLLIFPFIFAIDERYKNIPLGIRALVWFVIAVSIELLCALVGVPDWLYRLLYIRYFFAVILGIWIWQESPNKLASIMLLIASIFYIFGVNYLNIRELLFFNAPWGSQHAPSFFYTCFLIYILWILVSVRPKFFQPLLIIGKASLHIFLIQMFYFWIFRKYLNNYLEFGLLTTFISVFVCVTLGILFFYSEQFIRKMN